MTITEALVGSSYLFIRENGTIIGILDFKADGTIGRYAHFNEAGWRVEDDQLKLLRGDGLVASHFQSLSIHHTSFMGWMGCSEPYTIGWEKCCERFFLQKVVA